MIVLDVTNLKTERLSRVGEVLHFKIVSLYEMAPGKWKLRVEDVTPLSGAEPPGYACHVCGIIEEAKPDGSLPDGWSTREYKNGRCFLCSEDCRDARMCRVCGCTDGFPCYFEGGTCFWTEKDLCSACAEGGNNEG
jgi:hypothetical protein